jgi:hypothetical protein
MTLPDPPPDWGIDEISKFIDLARNNAYATYANLKLEYHRLTVIDEGFRKIIDNLYNTREWFASFFLIRAHSAFVAASQLSISTQVPESYTLLRSCLENALYGFYLSRNPASRATWLRRHDDESSKKKVRSEFQIRHLLHELGKEDATIGHAVEKLYERTIDYGAHPNESALLQTLMMEITDDHIDISLNYLMEDSPALRLSLRTVAQVGVCALEIFNLVFKERYDLLGLTETLTLLKKDL